MIDYSSWKRKKLNVSSLKLDIQNPRLSSFGDKEPNQTQIIEYLIAHENIHALAKNIANIGFLPTNEPIVYKEKDKYIVLEGNRRTAACKILNDPTLIKKNPKFRSFKSLASLVDANLIKQLTVIVAPSREAADTLIVNVHTDGSPIEKWDKTKQDRFFYNRFADGEAIETMSQKFNISKSVIKDAIASYNFYLEFLNLNLEPEMRKEIETGTKFSITTAERFYKSKQGRSFLEVDINKEGKIEHRLPRKEYEQRLTAIVEDLLSEKLNSRTYGKENQQKEYIQSLHERYKFDNTIVPSKTFQSEFENMQLTYQDEEVVLNDDLSVESTKKLSLSTRSAANKLIPPIAHSWTSGNSRIDDVFKELKNCNLNTQFNAAAILFRSYLDMTVYQFLQKKGMIIEVRKEEQKKIEADNDRKLTRLKNFLIDNGYSPESFSDKKLRKALILKTGVSHDWVPSLKQMLSFMVSESGLITDLKLRQALREYLKGNEEYIGHTDLNLLVHNAYYTKNKNELKKTWDKLHPLLEFIQKN